MSKRLDLTGQKFNRLTVLEYSHSDGHKTWWNCQCDCGTIKNVIGARLISGRIKSCGCFRRELGKESIRCNTKKRKEQGYAGLTKVISNYQKSAKERNLCFHLSREEVKHITSCNCHYCGEPPSQITVDKRKKSEEAIEHAKYISNGIDRVNNDLGYFIENCVPCCFRCNRAKLNFSYEEFIEWVKRVNSHLKLNEEKPYQPTEMTKYLNEIITFN